MPAKCFSRWSMRFPAGRSRLSSGRYSTGSPRVSLTRSPGGPRTAMTGKGATGTIHVRVVYASPDFSWQTSLALPAGATVMQAVAASDVARRVPGYSAAIMSFGIFGQNCGEDRVLVDGDRVEIYRPLTFDPMESRRRRAAHRKGAARGRSSGSG